MKPTIALAMIVKNEAAIIERCITSAIPFIDRFCIIDTGSTDGTQDLVQDLLRDVPGTFLEEKWVDYSANRNSLLKSARLEGTDYLLLLDADHEIEADPDALATLTEASYLISLAGPMEYWMPYLIRADKPFRYIGVTHEYLSCDESLELHHKLPNFVLHHYGDGGNRGTKYDNDLTLLKHEYELDPTNDRTTFYLAQTYKDCGDPEAARRLYAQRAEMGGWDEEVYWSLYQVATISNSIEDYVRAWNFRPSRPEAIHGLIQKLNQEYLHAAAYAIGRAWDRSRSDDMLFVERWMEEYGIAFEHAISTWWVGKKEESKKMFLELLNLDLPKSYRDAVINNLQHC